MGIAGSEIRRSKLRFGLLAGAVGLLGFLIMFQQALLGALTTSLRGALENQDADVVVYSDAANANLEASALTESQFEAVDFVEGVAKVGRIGQDTVTAVADSDFAGRAPSDLTLWGFEPGRPGEPTTLTEGRLPERPGEALASADTAREGFGIGDVVTIPAADDAEVEVVGLARDVRYAVAATLLMTFEGYEEIKLAANPAATFVPASAAAVRAEKGADPDTVAAAITSAIGGTEALSTAAAIEQLPTVMTLSSTFGAIIALTYVVAALVIGFFFAIITTQKRDALTLLLALGAGRRWLTLRSLLQVALVLLAGLALGVLLTVVSVNGMRSNGGLPVRSDPAAIGRAAAVLLCLGLFAFIPSALRIRRLDVVDAVRRPSLGGLG